jgi:hypothetical protein
VWLETISEPIDIPCEIMTNPNTSFNRKFGDRRIKRHPWGGRNTVADE